ncbi:hypothetical protein VP01_2905g3 [Puccinia sorghi]|uniref:SNF2 N-terminal domain-containing protein n=1 Tax=Puccinia sorghi TaxID=27349 RepID=A0A0L6V256_9BASI|nr:hypothetical protein VP01_2905g3 [Puccinia sorghi]
MSSTSHLKITEQTNRSTKLCHSPPRKKEYTHTISTFRFNGNFDGCQVQLMINQVNAVEFLMCFESDSPSIGETICSRGGIWADEMGLGKAVVTLSLILLTIGMPFKLVTAPLKTIEIWVKEIKQCLNPGGLPFQLFHSKMKLLIGLRNVKKSVIVLATYKRLICFKQVIQLE